MNKTFELKVKLADVHAERIYAAEISVKNGIIERIREIEEQDVNQTGFLVPGFVDAHVHVESSMLSPYEFSRLAFRHGTLASVSDPHEIANVLGSAGLDFMLESASKTPFCFAFGVPSCVPATRFETAGAELTVEEVDSWLGNAKMYYLAEMMNFPGVLHGDKEVLAKIAAAQKHGKPVDGHAPGLRGDDAQTYINAGISTDHECFTLEEARDKLSRGMKILIREGSAARNLEALWPILLETRDNVMLCSDDLHPDLFMTGHINRLLNRVVAKGVPVFRALRAACVNPVEHYKLPLGLLREGDAADFVLLSDLSKFQVEKVWKNGELLAEAGEVHLPPLPCPTPNKFIDATFSAEDFRVKAEEGEIVRIIEAIDGELITKERISNALTEDGYLQANVEDDELLLCVINRYEKRPPALALIKNIGLSCGAIGASVAHDSHNMVIVGCSAEALARAANLLVAHKGGLVWHNDREEKVLPLPVAGLMSPDSGEKVAADYTEIDLAAKSSGSRLRAPFMTLSFMALLVIPDLKLSDLGLFSGNAFEFCDLFPER